MLLPMGKIDYFSYPIGRAFLLRKWHFFLITSKFQALQVKNQYRRVGNINSVWRAVDEQRPESDPQRCINPALRKQRQWDQQQSRPSWSTEWAWGQPRLHEKHQQKQQHKIKAEIVEIFIILRARCLLTAIQKNRLVPILWKETNTWNPVGKKYYQCKDVQIICR